jgi:glutamyl-tRNA synthetase
VADQVRVRFAPSPTGYLHVGGARTALFNWLYARQRGGVFVLRMEDTDAARNTELARRTIFDGLHWLGLDPDEGPEQGGEHGPYSQSERDEVYAAAIAELKQRGALYPCFCTRERLAKLRAEQEKAQVDMGYDGTCRSLDASEAGARAAAGEAHAWRLRVPEGETVLDDLVRGEVTVQHADVEDIILVRSEGTPIYNLAVVVDDHHMRITHVLRGEDHLTNTFKQIIIFRALGWEPPRYAHLPLILGPAGEGKLSKRKHPEAALEHYMDGGYHPEALVNWLALLGWSFDDKTELMSRDELIERFSLERINKSGARLNLEKLAHLSGEYIRRMPLEDYRHRMREELVSAGFLAVGAPSHREEEQVPHLARILQERTHRFADVPELARWLYEDVAEYEPKAAKNLHKSPDVPGILRAYAQSLPDPLPQPSELEARARAFAEEQGIGFGKLVHPVRAAVTGRSSGPPLFDCIQLLGRDLARHRLEHAAGWAESGRS